MAVNNIYNSGDIVMSLFQWSDEYSVNIAEIDKQHQYLISLINTLHDAMREGKGNEIIESVLIDLVSYLKTHFETEEFLMRKFNFPGLTQHINEHIQFVKEVVSLEREILQGNRAVTTRTIRFLKNWVAGHIHGTDKSYGPFLNKCGVN